jgi:outer membrane protein TolC
LQTALLGALTLVAMLTLLVGNTEGAEPQQEGASHPLSLDEARELALANDEQLAQMHQVVLVAEADIMTAGADRLPQLELSGQWTRNIEKPSFFLPADMAEAFGGVSVIEMGGDWDLQAAATVTWNLWTAGRLSSAMGATREAHEATLWQEALVADAVLYQVEQAYYDVLLAAEDLAINDSARDLALENLRITQAAFDQGRSSRYDLLRAQVSATNREAPLIQARNNLKLARQRLLRYCGLAPETSLHLTDTFGQVNDPVGLDALLTETIQDSPEIRSLQHSVQAARLAVNLAKAGRGPIVQLQGQYALQGQWDDDLFPGDDEAVDSASAALGVVIPIFDGYAAKADISGRQAELRQAELELERITENRELGVRQARTYLVNALLALEGRNEGVDLAEETYRLAVIRLENGLATPLERLDAELALTEARAQLAQAQYACHVAEAGLKLAVGGSNPPQDHAQEN